jgi:hypothetical protein
LAEAKSGRAITRLVKNAGIVRPAGIDAATTADLQAVVAVNRQASPPWPVNVPAKRPLPQQYRHPMPIRVECYAGYRGDQEPLAFWLGDRRLAVRGIVDRWFAPTQRWFKVDADDGHLYVLRHDETSGDWDLAAYTRGAG